jgi:microcystin-dependent protein
MITLKPKLINFFILSFCFFFGKNLFALESLSYSGRLVQTNGAPVAGPVNIKAELVYTNNLSTVLCSDDISGVTLSKGVFHIKLDFTCSGGKSLTEVLSQAPVGESVAIQITDVTNSKSYSYQALHALPYANVASQLVQMAASDGQVLQWSNANKKWEPGTITVTGGTVTNVTTTSPLSVSNANSTPAISISQANGSTDGYLSSADWNSFNGKQDSIVAGTTAQYYRGDKTWQTLDTNNVPENTNLYFTNARVLGVPLTGFVTGTGAIVATDTTLDAFGKAQGQINSINTASANYLIKNSTDSVTGVVNVGTTGLLQLAYVPVGMSDAVNKSYADTKLNLTGGTLSGVLTVDDDLRLKGGSNHVTVKGHATSANYNLILPQTAGTSGYVLATDGSGNTSWISPSVGSSNITDGSIVDADVNASAGIAQSKIANLTSDLAGKEPTVAAGTTAQYWKGNKAWSSLQTDVQALVLNNFSIGTNASLANTDTVSGAFGKVQGQIDAINSSITGKEASLTAGSITQFYRGDKSWQTLNAGAVANTPAGTVAATTTQNAINELDTEKQDKLISTSVVDNRELRFYELPGNGTFYSSLKSPDDLAANINYTLPLIAPTAGQVLSSNASGVMNWITIPSSPVTTIFGRSGAVVATAGDYSASQMTNTPAGTISATEVQAALNELDTEKQSNISTGTTAQYYRGDKTWATFATDAINSVLSTFAVGTGTKPAVTNADSVVGAFGKVQKTLNDINSDYVSKTANQTINGTLAINSVTGFITVPTPVNPNDAANKSYVDGFGQWTKNGSKIYFNTGNVGIGLTDPLYALDMDVAASNGIRVNATSGQANIFLGQGGTFNGYINAAGGGGTDLSMFANRTLNLISGTTGGTSGIVLSTNGSEKVRITPTGNVGIGTTTPGSKLDVSGGEVQMGSSGAACSATNEGAQRYNSTSKQMEFCNGTAWASIGGGGSSPVASIETLMTATCPTGYLAANGSAVSRSTYSSLFTSIGVMYGAGDGSTTFNLPDLRGYFLRGVNASSGRDPDVASRTNRGDGTTGDAVGTKQADQYTSHTHGHDGYFVSAGTFGGDGDLDGSTAVTGYDKYTIAGTISAAGGNETRPKNINVLYCIKY